MFAKLNIEGLDGAEKAAKEVLEHVEAIRQALRGVNWAHIIVTTDLDSASDGDEGPRQR